MEQQNLITQLGPKLKQKSADNLTYRKALTIFESLMESTSAIPNFNYTIGKNQSNFALFVFGGVYKLLQKARKSQKDQFNIDAYVLILGLTASKVNLVTLLNSNLLIAIQNQIFSLVLWSQSSPLMIRHCIYILNLTLNLCLQTPSTFPQSFPLIQQLFQLSIQSSRTNIVSKQSSKLLSLIVHHNQSIAKSLSTQIKKSLLMSLDNRQQLYLNNVREVIHQFPLGLINDIVYRTAKNLNDLDHDNQQNQYYLSQLYYFVEKTIHKLTLNTLEQLLKDLMDNVPTKNDGEKIVFCYLQALYQIAVQSANKNAKILNKYLSSVVSIFQEFLLMGGKIQKHAFGLLKHLMKNGIKSQLWTQVNVDSNDIFGIQNINLQGSKQSHDFGKVICMLKSMLSSRFSNTKQTSYILCQFFQSLDQSSFSQSEQLIIQIINFREQFDEKSFKRLMHSIYIAFGPKKILEMYPISINGDISEPSFQLNNNLWIIPSLQKYTGQEEMEVFGNCFVPILAQINQITDNQTITKVRKQAYFNIAQMIWHCFKVFCKAINKRTNYQSLFVLIDGQITSVNDSTQDHISVGLQKLCQNLYKNEYHSKISENLIKNFASSLNLQKHNSKQILQAIKSLALITDQQYLNRVFQKNIIKLIEGQEKGTLQSDTTIQTNLKNLEILMAVCSGINFNDPTVISNHRISKQQLVIKLVKSLIGKKSIFQKKGYKFILQTLNQMPQSFMQQIIQVIESDQKVLPASKHYRIAILYQLWSRLSSAQQTQRNIQNIFNFIKSYLPEILTALKESNKRARKQATKLFQQFYARLNQMGLLENFVQIICAGFTSQRTEIKVATIYGLVQIINKKDHQLQRAFLNEVFQLVVLLLKDKKHQIYKAVVDYSKKYVSKMQKSQQLVILPELIKQLFVVDEQSKMQERSILKHFLLKLVKRHSRQTIEKMIPQSDRKILSNAIKIQNRLKKKQRQQNKMRREQYQQRKRAQKAAHQSDSDSSSQEEQVQQDNNQMKDEGQQKLQALQNTDNLLLKYDLEKENFHFQEKKLNTLSEQRHLRKQKEQLKNQDVVFDELGFMVVKDDAKRRRRDQTNDENQKQDEDQQQRQQYLNLKKKVKTDTVHQIKQSGDAFKSNRAGGDVRRKDQPEPYAFIQFNSKALNKRFKKKAQKIFDTIFERKQGGLKGIKSRVLTKSN